MNPDTLTALIFWYPVFLFSICAHEAAHAWAALKGGDPTAAAGGQASLSPWPHIRRSPMGMVVVPLITSLLNGWPMGWASAPYDLAWAERYPRRAAWMAAAGPGANLVLALIAVGMIVLGLAAGWFEAPLQTIRLCQLVEPAARHRNVIELGFLAQLLSVTCSLNLLLMFFNLLPIPPLDGASVITLVLPERIGSAWRQAVTMPGAQFIGMFVIYQMTPNLIVPVLTLIAACLYPGSGN